MPEYNDIEVEGDQAFIGVSPEYAVEGPSRQPVVTDDEVEQKALQVERDKAARGADWRGSTIAPVHPSERDATRDPRVVSSDKETAEVQHAEKLPTVEGASIEGATRTSGTKLVQTEEEQDEAPKATAKKSTTKLPSAPAKAENTEENKPAEG